MDYLATRFSIPLEREYEAWVIEQIERYFRKLRIAVTVFAVSPDDETTWPADEVVDLSGKVMGLQFKRPKLGSPTGVNAFDRLHWDLSQPAGQLQNVVAHSEIFYCLPTFVNREVRRFALHHSLFWRPSDSSDQTAWYMNNSPRVKTKHKAICEATRWGLLAERFVSCQIGHRFEGQPFSEYIRALRDPVGREGNATMSVIQMLVLHPSC